MSETEISLEEAIIYMKEVSKHEKNKRFHKFVEGAIVLLNYFAETDVEGLDLLINVLLDTTDEYLQTKNPELLKEALNYLDIKDD